jgi:hypothetical protein
VALVDPATHAYPARQGPVHPDTVTPGKLPYLPGSHGAVQEGEVRPLLPPYCPAGQSLQAPAPTREYLPGPHRDVVGVTDPAGHAYPAVQLSTQEGRVAPGASPYRPAAHNPEHPGDVRAGVAPYSPAAHRVHVPTPPTENRPGGHCTAVALVLPAGHAYPATHAPLQPAVVSAGSAPYKPAGQGPLHAAVGVASVAPYSPGAQSTQTNAPARLYLPLGHGACVADVDPGAHTYPGAQSAVHVEVYSPGAPPYLPAAQDPVQEALVSPAVDPYRPWGQAEQVPEAGPENWPGPHRTTVGLVDPAAQAYPAVQLPVHAGDVRPLVAP